ncbi:hypothetical protein [Neptuniibacter sp.]|uniref:hypothetical protein n=1 Tax=Neptuniibacter sp. TaxID=1962643 RepID=UPI0026317577|nr:hypothetical protein [Neptuniibacter sp.]MCP4598502.1 hypothetical protein [Neptuniibacter sp.]
MAIRVSHTPISAYGRAAYQTGRGEAVQRSQELALKRDQMVMQQEAQNKAFALQEAAGQRAERTLMAGMERQGRMDLAGFNEMKRRRRGIEQNMADWETLSGTIPESEYRRGVIAIRSGKTPQYLKQQRDPTPKNRYRAGDRDALFNMATAYAQAGKSSRRWGPNYRQKDLIVQYKQFLRDNDFADLQTQQDRDMVEFQWEEAMAADWGEGGTKNFEWDPSSKEVQEAREEMRQDLSSDLKSEVGNYMMFLERQGGEKAVAEFQKKWRNPANRPIMLAKMRQTYGNVQ